MRVVHDNFVTLPANARELALGEELNNLLSCVVCSGWHVAKNPLSLTSIVEKNRSGSRDPATTKMELYVARLLDLDLIDMLVTQKKLFLLGHLKTFNVKALRTLKTSWKQEIGLTQPQAPTSRNCAAGLLKFSVIIRSEPQMCNGVVSP